MTTQTEALQLALEALTGLLDEWTPARQAQLNGMDAVTAIKEALAEPEQRSVSEHLEPVAWMSPNKERLEFSRKDTVYGSHTIPLYTTPPQRKPLTDEEKENAFLVTTTSDFDPLQNFFDGVAFAEIYYGIKE